MSGEIFDFNPDTGATTYYIDDPANDGFTLKTVIDAEPLLDANHELSADWSTWRGDMRLEARIPAIVLLDWARQDGVPPNMVFSDEYAERVNRRLNSSEFRRFKTADVRI